MYQREFVLGVVVKGITEEVGRGCSTLFTALPPPGSKRMLPIAPNLAPCLPSYDCQGLSDDRKLLQKESHSMGNSMGNTHLLHIGAGEFISFSLVQQNYVCVNMEDKCMAELELLETTQTSASHSGFGK